MCMRSSESQSHRLSLIAAGRWRRREVRLTGETLLRPLCKPPRALFVRDSRLLLSENEISHHQHVHLGPAETIERFFGPADDGLIVVEGCIQDNRDAGQIAEGAQ